MWAACATGLYKWFHRVKTDGKWIFALTQLCLRARLAAPLQTHRCCPGSVTNTTPARARAETVTVPDDETPARRPKVCYLHELP